MKDDGLMTTTAMPAIYGVPNGRLDISLAVPVIYDFAAIMARRMIGKRLRICHM